MKIIFPAEKKMNIPFLIPLLNPPQNLENLNKKPKLVISPF